MEQQNQDGPRYFSFMLTAFAILILWRFLFPIQPPVDPRVANGNEGIRDPTVAVASRTALDELLPFAAPAGEMVADVPAIISLGSIDHTTGYRMQVNFASRGGVVRRLQLSSPSYLDIDDRSGHLGAIEATDSEGGVLVNAVPAGSPAEEAGLEVGDVITAAGLKETRKVADFEQFQKVLSRTKPRNELKLTVNRNGATRSLSAQLVRAPLDLIRPEAENIALFSDELPEDFFERNSFELQISSIGPVKPADEVLKAVNETLRLGDWMVDEPDADTVVFRKRVPELKIELVKRFTLDRVPETEIDNPDFPGYDLKLAIEIKNLSPQPQTVAYRVQGPTGLPIEGWWYANKIGKGFFSAVGIRDVIVRVFDKSFTQFGCPEITKGDTESVGQGSPIAFAGVDAQYFCAAMLPEKESRDDTWVESVDAALASTKLSKNQPIKYNNSSFTMTRKPVALAALGLDGSSQQDTYEVFAGPKRPDLLDKYRAAGDAGHTLSDFLYFGWFWWVAKPMLVILHFFAWLVGNYGIAIVMLTVLVRGSMFPISRKQAKNMMKMQELKPELDRITAKYKDDMQKRSAAQQALWKQHGYNPMAGCLPMLLQFPIFIGLYRSLMVDVELRQTPLFSESIRFCSNLAAPDMLFDWSSWWWQSFNNGDGIFALGPYLNILPLLTVGLFVLQQKMFMPPATDEQTAMTQKIMQYMMIFMGFMFFKVASGLCLYFIASSLWGITERKLIPKPKLPATAPTALVTTKPKASSGESAKATERARRKKKGK